MEALAVDLPAKRRASQGALFSPGAPEPEGIEGDDDDGAPSPNDIAAWLLVNSMASEKVQFHLLCEQSLANVWRKASYIKLLGEFKADPRRSLTDVEGEDAQWLAGPRQLLDIYREQPDLDVAEFTMPEEPDGSRRGPDGVRHSRHENRAEAILNKHKALLTEPKQREVLQHIERLLTDAELADMPEYVDHGGEAQRARRQNEEQEQHQEQEEEQEQEQEEEKVREEDVVETAVDEAGQKEWAKEEAAVEHRALKLERSPDKESSWEEKMKSQAARAAAPSTRSPTSASSSRRRRSSTRSSSRRTSRSRTTSTRRSGGRRRTAASRTSSS